MVHLHTYNPRVLVVEDHEFQRKAIVAALSSIGVERVTEAENAEMALEILKSGSERFEATICDLQLGIMDGIEFLRTAPAESLGTIILTSALPLDIRSSSQRVLMQSRLRIAGCLPKPVDTTELKQMLIEPPRDKSFSRGTALAALQNPESVQRSELEHALAQGEFITYFQPKVELQQQVFAGAEALVRWAHPNRGVLPPSQFLDDIEHLGLMDELTEQVFEQACDFMRAWPADLPALHLSINISASSLQSPAPAACWHSILRSKGVDPRSLTLELTETTFLADDLVLLEALTRLRIAGFCISLDDFGSGFTSLRQLRNLPMTELKIDRSFVSDAARSSRLAIILDSLVNVAKRLRISTVAEGVETIDDVNYLKALGCQIGQGYYYARPLPGPQLIDWVRKFSQKTETSDRQADAS